MSTATKPQETPRVPWVYLGGMILILIGFFLSYFGGFFFNGGNNILIRPTETDKLTYLMLVALGVAVFAFGCFVLARLPQVPGRDLSLVAVAFIMMPLPAVVSYGVHFLGNYLRRTQSTTVQVILVGVGIFFLTLAGNWAWGLHDGGVVRVDFQAFAWPICADFGVVCVLLAVLPMFGSNQSVEAAPHLGLDQAPSEA